MTVEEDQQVTGAVALRIGETITQTVVVSEADLLQTKRDSYALTSEQLDILLMRDGRSNTVLEIGVSAAVTAFLAVCVALLKWAGEDPRPDWWSATKEHVWLFLLACAITAGSWFTIRSESSAREKLVSKLRNHFDGQR